MKTHILHIIAIGVLLVPKVNAQVIDTSRAINTWNLVHNYSRFEDVELDSNLFDLHLDIDPLNRNGFAYEQIGMIGGPAQNLDLFERPGTSSFLFGSSLYPHLADPDRTIFFNTRKPFTEVIYSNIPGVDWKEETVSFTHTQNMDPFTNVGLDFELLSADELYNNQQTRVTKFTLFGSRAKNKYSAFGTFHYNRFTSLENGGLERPDALRKDSIEERFLYPVNLDNASSRYTRLQFFYTQKFMITQKQYFTDSTGVTTDSGRNFSFNHQINAEHNARYFQDNFPNLSLVPDIYNNYYYFHNSPKDSVLHDKITNTFQFILGDPYTDKLSTRIYGGHELSRYGQRSPRQYQVFSHFDTISQIPLQLDSVFKDTAGTSFYNQIFNDLFVGFYMAGPPEKIWDWNVDGKYYLAGYYRNNFSASATFSRQVFKNYRLGLSGKIENRNVSYYHNHYSSAFFKWDNNFKASQLIRAMAFLNSAEHRLQANFSVGVWTNYLYWNYDALPDQFTLPIYLISGNIFKHFSVSGFNSRNHLLFQVSSADEILRLPLVSARTSNYWEQVLFKGALTAQLGFDLYITTPYAGNAYMPATGVFYLQDEETVGGYPYADAFLNIRIKRTRIFVAYNNLLAGVISNNYFSIANYPEKPRFFRFGVAWTFYD